MSDLIDRQEAIDALDKRFDSIPMEQTAEILQLRKDLRELPSAQPERNQGHWIGIDDEPCETWECDKCGCIQECFDGEQPNFCPHCGADMTGGG